MAGTLANTDTWKLQYHQVVDQFGAFHGTPLTPMPWAFEIYLFWANVVGKLADRGWYPDTVDTEESAIRDEDRKRMFDYVADWVWILDDPKSRYIGTGDVPFLHSDIATRFWDDTARIAATLDAWASLPDGWDYFNQLPVAGKEVLGALGDAAGKAAANVANAAGKGAGEAAKGFFEALDSWLLLLAGGVALYLATRKK